MTREERIEYLAKAVMTLSELGDNKTAYVLNEIRLELKRQPSLPSDMDEAAEKEMPEGYGFLELDIYGGSETVYSREQMLSMFKAGAEWQKAKMLEDAVEGEVCGRVRDHINVRFADGVSIYLEPKNISHIPADISKYAVGDRVKIVIVPIKED